MSPETHAEIELPASARPGTRAPVPGLPPQISRALLGVAAVACAAASVLMLSLGPRLGSVAALFALLSLTALAMTRLPAARRAPALTAMLLLVMIAVAYAAVQIEMAERLLGWRAEHLDQTLALQELTANGVVSVSR